MATVESEIRVRPEPRDYDLALQARLACMKQAPIQTLNQALAEGMNAHSEFGTRGVPLIVTAARYGAAEALKVLLEAGADLSEQDNDGNTAPMVARDPEVIAIIVATQAAECVVNQLKVPATRVARETL